MASLKGITWMTKARITFVVLLAAAISAGCTGSESDARFGTAERLEGWNGIRNLSKDGRFYFGGQPNESTFRRLVEEEKIELVVNLRLPREMERLSIDESALARELGIRYLNIPVEHGEISAEDVDLFAGVVAETDGAVLLHCTSSNRVGGFWAAYLVRVHGFEIRDALARGRAAGMSTDQVAAAARRVMEER